MSAEIEAEIANFEKSFIETAKAFDRVKKAYLSLKAQDKEREKKEAWFRDMQKAFNNSGGTQNEFGR